MTDVLRIESHARLHFGLMEICPGQPNCYGGIGMMIDEPQAQLFVTAAPAQTPDQVEIVADDYWRPRIDAALRHWQSLHNGDALPVKRVQLVDPPMPHTGLGSGTQLACSMATALAAARSNLTSLDSGMSVAELARISGRGKRSFIGLAGFLTGGFIIDRGQSDNSSSAQHHGNARVESVPMPDAWRIVLISDLSDQGDFGAREAAMFEQCAQSPNAHRNDMVSLIEDELLPSLEKQDWKTFSKSVGTYGAWAGEIFSRVQGGIYRTPSIASKVELLSGLGFEGSGQSSWGPTVFAIARDEDQASWLQSKLIGQLPGDHLVRTVRSAAPAKIICD